MPRPLLLVLVAILAGIAASIVTYHVITDRNRADDAMMDWHPHQPALGR
jgi:hypothetical protein